MPSSRNFDRQFGKSTTCAASVAVQSVEMVSGRNPASSPRSTTFHRSGRCVRSRRRTRPRACAPRALPAGCGRCRRGCCAAPARYIWVTMSPGLSSARIFGIGETVWPMWIITGRSNEEATSCARFSTSRSPAPATLKDRRALTPTIMSRWRAMAARAAATSARLMSVSARRSGRMPGACRGRSARGRASARPPRSPRFVDASAPWIRHRRNRHAVREADRRAVLGAGGVGMDVDQAGNHELAARIEHFGGVRRDPSRSRRRGRRRSRCRESRRSPDGSMTRPPLMSRS